MKIKNYGRFGWVLSTLACVATFSVSSQAQTMVAYDNGDLYPGNPDHGWPGFNGGYGYDNWIPLADTGGGGTYMEGVGVNGRQVEGAYSFALYSGGGYYDISRQLINPVTAFGSFSIITRFDIAGGPAPNVVNLRSGNNLASFGVAANCSPSASSMATS